MTNHQAGRGWKTGAMAISVFLAATLVGTEGSAPALINESPSLPRGLYLRIGAAIEPGAVVAVPQPAVVRPYFERLGVPADVALLKRVVAVGGEPVCAEGGAVRTLDRRAIALERDRQGVVLPAWRECRVLASDEVFLLGDTPGSFDSRYFGPVRRADIAGVYREVLRW